MVDYSVIDSFDPEFLATFMKPNAKSEKDFRGTEDEVKVFSFDGKEYPRLLPSKYNTRAARPSP